MDEPTILPTQAGHGKGVARPWEVQGSECWASGKESRSWNFKKVPTWERKAQTRGWLHLLSNISALGNSAPNSQTHASKSWSVLHLYPYDTLWLMPLSPAACSNTGMEMFEVTQITII